MGRSGAADAKALSHRERVLAKWAGEGLRRLSLHPEFRRHIPSSVAFGDTFSLLWEKGSA
jgi:hypothetical protein